MVMIVHTCLNAAYANHHFAILFINVVYTTPTNKRNIV